MTTRAAVVAVATKALAGLTDAIAVAGDAHPELARCLRAEAAVLQDVPSEAKSLAGLVAGLTWNVKLATRQAATIRAAQRAAIVPAPVLERMLAVHERCLAQVVEQINVTAAEGLITRDQREALLAIADIAEVDDLDEAAPAPKAVEAPPPMPAPGSSAASPLYIDVARKPESFEIVRDDQGRVAGTRSL